MEQQNFLSWSYSSLMHEEKALNYTVFLIVLITKYCFYG